MYERAPVVAEYIASVADVGLRELELQDVQAFFALIDYDREHFSSMQEVVGIKYTCTEDVYKSFEYVTPGTRLGIFAGHELVGSISYSTTDEVSAEISYWVGAQHVQNGYAKQAICAIKPLLKAMGYEHLNALIWENNFASQKTALAAGFTLVGRRGWDYIQYTCEL